MKTLYNNFIKQLNLTQNSEAVYLQLSQKMPLFDSSDLLRWEWVQCISALDKFIHDIVRVGILEIYQGQRVCTKKYKKFNLSIEDAKQLSTMNITDAIPVLDEIVKKQLGFLSFENPDNIADGLGYIWNQSDKWAVLSEDMEMEKDDCKKYLHNIVLRRNQIVHESDYIDAFGERQTINLSSVVEMRSFIEKLGDSINRHCSINVCGKNSVSVGF